MLSSYDQDFTLIILFLVLHFNFFVYSVWQTKLATRQLFTAR